jgi:hypothetical protein
VDLTFTDAEGDIDLSLLNPAGTSVASSASTSNNESVTHTVTSAGTYAIRVYLYADAGTTPGNTYGMNIQRSGCASDSYEPNNSRQAAPVMTMSSYPALTVCPSDDDFYNISLSANDILTVDVLFTHAEGDVDVTLVNASDSVVARSESTADNEQIVYTAPSAGTYAVRVYLYADTGSTPGNSYTLTLSR